MPFTATPSRCQAVRWVFNRRRSASTVAIASTLALGLSFALAACGKRSASKLDAPMIQAMVRAGAQAAAARDAQAVCMQFADEATIQLVQVRFSGSEVSTLSKSQYCQLAEAGYAAMPAGANVRYSADVQSIEIAADGQSAELIGQANEEIELGGQSLRMSTQQSSTVVLVNGQPRYSRLSARMTAQQPQ